MKPNPSPLNIIDYAVTKFKFEMVPVKDKEVDFPNDFRNYSLDIDFGLERSKFTRVMIKGDINKDGGEPGYIIEAEVICIFEYDAKINSNPGVKESLEGFSTIYIALNCLRGIISNFTANAPFGRYVLPSIDLNDLIEKKQTVSKQKKDDLSEKKIKKTAIKKSKTKMTKK